MSSRLSFLATIALLGACADRDAARPVDSSPAPNQVSLTATEYAVGAPDSIPAGWTTFRMANQGEEIHYGHIVQLEPGKSVQDLVNAYLLAIRTSGPRPKWVKRFGGPGGTPPGGTASVTQHLEVGSYVWICPIEDGEGQPHFAKGEVKPFVVHASRPAGAGQSAAPEASAVIRLLDFSFAVQAPVNAGRHTVRVENAGVEPHDLVLMKLNPGRTIEDIRTWLNPERARRPGERDQPPPPLESIGTLAGGVAAIAPQMSVYFDAEFTPGDYVLICMATAPDGRSHIEHGMIQQLSIAAAS